MRRRAAIVAAVVSLASPAKSLAAGWGGALGAASDYVLRGITQSDHLPSAQGDIHYLANSGLSAGIWSVTVKEGSDRPVTAEVNGYVGYSRALTENWNAQLTLTHYAYPGYAPRREYDYDEAAGSLSYRDRFTFVATASPNSSIDSSRGDVSSRPAYSYEVILRQPMPAAFSVDAGIGYNDLHQLVDTGYVYWNAGIGYDYRAFHLQLAYIGTDHRARTLVGDEATNRVIGSVVWRF